MAIKQNDFIEIDYTGTVKEDNMIFDTTDEKTAKDNDIHNEEMTYGPVIICVGEKQVIKGLDEWIVGKDAGEYDVSLKPEDAFGRKDAKLLKLIPTNVFFKQQINPVPGLQVNMDGVVGTIKTVSGGRTFVDFNHPLSGKEVSYHVKVHRIVTDDKEKLESIAKLQFGSKRTKVEIKEDVAEIDIGIDVPAQVGEQITAKMKELIPTLKDIKFKEQPKAEKKGKEGNTLEEKKKEAEGKEAPAEPGNKQEN